MKFSKFQTCLLVVVLFSSIVEENIFVFSEQNVGFFIFGDSILDAGNNNYINTTTNFQANFPPYGLTFFHNPTGRFSDGRLIPDFIAEYAKLPLIRPYLDPHNNLYIHGVNFASGGSGALLESHQGSAITLQTQLTNFIEVGKSLRKKLGDNRAQNLLSNSVYLISTGGNDYISLFEGDSTAFQIYTQTQYVNMVIGNLTTVIQEIYKNGGRKFGLVGVPSLGCMPRLKMLKGEGHGKCVEEASSIVNLHNKLLPIALQNLATQLNGFKYAFADANNLLLQIIQNPSKYGFKEVETACCGSGEYRGIYSCGGRRGTKEFKLCEDPTKYLFFDSYHPNQKAYEQLARLMWSGDEQVINPYNLKQLFQYGSPSLAYE
ncbi:GDSL esterase/lipase 5 [Cucumis sativus]|uniref:Zinc finger protein n=1 Tax=Cucumis sativus TaxID=3659 RepID=A0A0A0LMU6_CUCSA|nr:GDSL esterase/lipase 5 [Cucumis sativus]KGN62087.1 hypothetical protein Csa_006646 [Cucumis sativus]